MIKRVTMAAVLLIALQAPLWAADKLLQQSDFTYLGAFRVPNASLGSSLYSGFTYGGSVIAYNPANSSLFIVGCTQDQMVAEISIPEPTNTANINSMKTATALQNLADITEGNLTHINAGGAPATDNKVLVGGLLVYGNKLIGTAYNYYDGAWAAVLTHFTSGLTLSTTGDFRGMYQVGSAPTVVQAGFIAGYMTKIPSEYQAALGGPALTGQAALSVSGRSSWGPSAFSFDPSRLGIDNPVAVYPMVYYPLDHQTLAVWSHETPANPYMALGDQITGIAFPSGTRTILFSGQHGLGDSCYGVGGATDPGGHSGVDYCYDPVNDSKGSHAYPYKNYIWAYDVNDFIAVKNGSKNPWDIRPYTVFPLSLPTTQNNFSLSNGAAAYDDVNKKLYIVQVGGDVVDYDVLPLIHVFKVNTGSSGDSVAPAAPTGLKSAP